MYNPFDFTGKKIIITGATSGIGKATAIKLSQQGAQLHILARNEEKAKETLQELAGDGHRYYLKDFSQPGGYKEIFDEIVSDGRKIDGMVYCAGIAKILPVTLLNKKNMDETMTVNLYAYTEMAGLLSKKKYHDKASIVGVSSYAAEQSMKCQSAYAASKAAMNAATTAMARELIPKNIRINTVMPAFVDTKMHKESLQYDNAEATIDNAIANQLLGLSQPEDIADVIIFLLSDASRVIGGRSIYADAACFS